MSTLRRVGARRLAARARLRRRRARDLHRAGAQGSRPRPGRRRHTRVHGTEHFLPFAYLLTALLFARSGLYAERALRPGLLADRRARCSRWRCVALIFAVVSGEHFSSYYLFYGSLAFAIFYVSSLRGVYERVTAAAAARRRLPAPRGARRPRQAHRRRRPRARRRAALADRGRRLPLAQPAARQRPALARHARGPRGACSARSAIDEVIIADPDFPQDDAVELVDQCHRRGIRVRLAPSTMEILIHRAEFVPGQSVPLFELGPPVFEGVDFALKRTFDIIGATLLLVAAQPAAARDHARRAAHLARPDPVPLDAPRHRPAAVRLPEVPHDAHRRRGAPGRPRRAQRGLGRAVQDPRRPAPDARRAAAAPLLARRAAAADQRAARRDVARRSAAAARARLRDARGLAPQALPGAARASPACGRSRAAPSSTSTTSCTSTSSTSSAGRWRST